MSKSNCCFQCNRRKVTEDFNCHDDEIYCPTYKSRKDDNKRISEEKLEEFGGVYHSKVRTKFYGRK